MHPEMEMAMEPEELTEERLELFRAQVQSKRYSVGKLRLSWWLAEIERRHRSCPT